MTRNRDLPSWVYLLLIGVFFSGMVWFGREWLDIRFSSVHARLTNIEHNTEDLATWKDRVGVMWQRMFGVAI